MVKQTRRRLLAVVGAAGVLPTAAAPLHPDAELLALCAQLRAMAAEHERLRALTSDAPEDVTPADHAWSDFRDHVWPGYALTRNERWRTKQNRPDVPGRLLELRATTVEGLAAKAAAVLAMDNLPGLDLRDDSYELNRSVIEDAASLFRASA